MADKAGVASRLGAAKSGAAAVAASEERSSSSPQRSGAPRKRIRNFTADDRAAHRVFEKSRREAFKHKLIELANLLPVMLDVDSRRLSKHVVVDESINRHRFQQARCESASQGIRTLLEERDTLLSEVNRWRADTGAAAAMPIVSAGMFSNLLAAEQEMFKEKLGSVGRTPPSQRGGAMIIDEDGYGSGESPAGSAEEMTMRAGVPSQGPPGMPVLDPSLRVVERVDIQPPTNMSDKEAAAMAARRPHPDMDMHRATMFGTFEMAGIPQGPPQPQPHHQQQQQQQHQQRLPTEYLPHPPTNGMRVGVDLRHNGGVSPAQQQQQLAPPGAYDPVAAAAQHQHAHGHAHAHGSMQPGHAHDQAQHTSAHGALGTHSIPMPTTQAQAQYMNHMGIPYMSNMGWQ